MNDSPSALSSQAIAAALSAQWEEAIQINEQIIALDSGNVDALNRIGRAYFETGDLEKSKSFFEKALACDPYNQIAGKFIKRLETFSKKGSKIPVRTDNTVAPTLYNSDLFIEEPGKTQITTLLKVAEPQKLSQLWAGVEVYLVIKNRGITITDKNNEYLGVLPDDLSYRLIRLLNGGNKYQAWIKAVKTNGLSIILREVFRSARFRNQPSFLEGLDTNLTYSSSNLIFMDEGEEDPPFEDTGDEEDAG